MVGTGSSALATASSRGGGAASRAGPNLRQMFTLGPPCRQKEGAGVAVADPPRRQHGAGTTATRALAGSRTIRHCAMLAVLRVHRAPDGALDVAATGGTGEDPSLTIPR
jgi:hypothetical protein